MRIVVLNEKKPERDAMMRALTAAKYQAEGAGDEAAALTAIMREAPQIVVFSVPSKGGVDLVRRLKGTDASNQAYLLALFDAAPSERELTAVLDAGANDFLRRPVVDVELMQRLKAPARLMRWARSVAMPAAFDLSAPLQVSRLKAWSQLGQLMAADLSEMAGQPFSASNVWPKHFVHDLRGASIPMSLAGEQLELRVSIVADSVALHWLKATLLADPNATADAADDALRELANTAGGALKRAALAENVSLTTGIPSTDRVTPPSADHSCWTLSLDGEACCLAVIGEARQRVNERVSSSRLAEGMILAHDVRNEGGILLAPAGSRLTSTTASKLAKMLGPRFFIEVAPPA
jgi:DNA-binding response OmpR family regulator